MNDEEKTRKFVDGFYNPNMIDGIKHDILFEHEKWREILRKLPPIVLPERCGFKAWPPFTGAVSRFGVVCLDTEFFVSVYLDCYNILGQYGKPYWEIYPIHGDTERYDIEDIDGLNKGIAEAIEQQRKG